MSLTVEKPDSNGNYEMIPTGLHPGILIWIVDLGHQETPWGWKKRVMFTFELPKQVIEIDRGYEPKVISIELSPVLHEKSNLTRLLTGWFGKAPDEGFNLRKLVGRHAMVNIAHQTKGDKTYANISSLTAPTDECKQFKSSNDEIVFEFGVDQLPQSLPEWIRVKVMRSREWNESGQQNHEPQDVSGMTQDDDPPF